MCIHWIGMTSKYEGLSLAEKALASAHCPHIHRPHLLAMHREPALPQILPVRQSGPAHRSRIAILRCVSLAGLVPSGPPYCTTKCNIHQNILSRVLGLQDTRTACKPRGALSECRKVAESRICGS